MDFVAEPIFILSVCIGILNILERVGLQDLTDLDFTVPK